MYHVEYHTASVKKNQYFYMWQGEIAFLANSHLPMRLNIVYIDKYFGIDRLTNQELFIVSKLYK